MPSPPPQPVPTRTTRSSNPHPGPGNLGAPSSLRMDASPMSYGAMTGISFTNGGGFSFENKPRSVKWGNGNMGSYGAKFYGDAGGDSPTIPFSTSISMEPSSFAASANAFGLPSGSMSSSYQRRSYAAVASTSHYNNLSSSFASMSFQPMSLGTSFQPGTSYSKSQVRQLMRSDAELTKQYECCGQSHKGLHELLEHVEDCHPFADPNMPPTEGFSPVTNAMELEMDDVEEDVPPTASNSSQSSISPNLTHPQPVPSYPLPTPGRSSKGSTPTGEASVGKSPLKLSDVLKSPPDADTTIRASNLTLTRTGSTGSSPPDGSLATPTTSTQPSPVFTQPKINPARPSFLGSTGTGVRPAAQQKRFDRAFNEVVAGRKDEIAQTKGDTTSTVPTAVAPGVLFASAVSSLGIPTVPPTANGQPKSASGTTTPQEVLEGELPAPNGTKSTFPEPPLPQPSLFSSHKPWRCPNPGCNKAYKQSNGLKYHQQKGQCDFAIHDAVDLGLTLEEAEERNRPFVCAVGAGCNKRYRQMNGLKYHYLNSGEHGQYGLRMLQNGTHPHPPSLPPPAVKPTRPMGTSSTTSSATSTPTRPTPAAGAPYAIPSHARPQTNGSTLPGRTVGGTTSGMPRMGTWPSAPRGIPSKSNPPPKVVQPPVPQPQPVTKGRDAVLFAAVGEDPMDVMGRMDQ
ncbi:hypothetical protein CI109_101852 [Kwoniella shandongensis]|uniref:Uncharacterized protein n=1 Tax=Kwoniella shandongensis TaxID=1734106 RepID=A0A5M6BP28_9TREE|nr:uncharacterized protein CI109_007032 [Kwoniella shandongensis]KAA5524646.1 hypothetical protein CI109_007032 [Kwoniella shandongensis]